MAASLLALANFHLQFTNKSVGSLWRPPLARRPLLIALQVVRTTFGFHLREYMGSIPPPGGRLLQLIHIDLHCHPFIKRYINSWTKPF